MMGYLWTTKSKFNAAVFWLHFCLWKKNFLKKSISLILFERQGDREEEPDEDKDIELPSTGSLPEA